MSTIYRVVMLSTLLLLAGACYLLGSSAGLGFFLVVGVLFEAAFWKGLFKPRDHGINDQ